MHEDPASRILPPGLHARLAAGPLGALRRSLGPRGWVPRQYAARPLVLEPADSRSARIEDAPSFAIVTPSRDQGRFIGATIASVLDQHYPRLSYRICDGGSTDATVGILASFGDAVSWDSRPDGGQADAINRGFVGIDGDIMAYLNSDDLLMPGTLAYVARFFRTNPQVDIVYGHRIYIDANGDEIGRCILPAHDDETLKWIDFVPQETLFWRRRVWDAVGPFDNDFHFALDWDFLLRAQAAGFVFRRLPRFLGCFRHHPEQKSVRMIETIGEQEMVRLRSRTLGQTPSRHEIRRASARYLVRQRMREWLWRLGALRG